MSGPIVRKYGFPNYDRIFGKKEVEHGVSEGPETAGPTAAAEPAALEPEVKAKPQPKKSSKRK